MIKYDKLWATMKEKGITKYALYTEYHFSKSLLYRLQHNEGINMNTIDITKISCRRNAAILDNRKGILCSISSG